MSRSRHREGMTTDSERNRFSRLNAGRGARWHEVYRAILDAGISELKSTIPVQQITETGPGRSR
jgi:hypothetical protein